MTTTESDQSTIAEVLEAEDAWLRGIATRDWAALAEIVHNDFTYTHTHGQVENKEQWLAALKKTTKLTEKGEQSIQVHGDVALLSGALKNTLVVEGKVLHSLQDVLQVWIKRDGRWQLVAHHGQSANNR